MADADTPSKRYSIMNLSCPWRILLPIPDGTLNQGDRQHLLYYYSGIAWAGGVAAASILWRTVWRPRRGR